MVLGNNYFNFSVTLVMCGAHYFKFDPRRLEASEQSCKNRVSAKILGVNKCVFKKNRYSIVLCWP